MSFYSNNKNSLKNIAIFRALQLGDLLCLVPSLRALRKAFPESEITLIGLPWASVFAARFSSYIDKFIEFPGYPGLPERKPQLNKIPAFIERCRQKKFDLAMQMHGDGSIVNPLVFSFGASRTAGFFKDKMPKIDSDYFLRWPEKGHEIKRMLELLKHLGIPLSGQKLEFPENKNDKPEFLKIKREFGLKEGKYILIHPGARLSSRRWETKRFFSLAQRLANKGKKIAVTGTAKEERFIKNNFGGFLKKAAWLVGKTSLGCLAQVIKHSSLLIANDTGVSHIACAMRSKSLIIVTGSDPNRWAPLNHRQHSYIYYPVPCRPCNFSVCPIGQPCSKAISVDDVFKATENILMEDKNAPV